MTNIKETNFGILPPLSNKFTASNFTATTPASLSLFPNEPPTSSLFAPIFHDCSGCCQKITEDQCISTEDGIWHEKCLVCCVCGANLADAQSCYTKNGKVYCKRDYYREFSGPKNRCKNCNHAILPTEFVMRAKENAYHVQCFVCAICEKLFKTGDHIAFHDNKIYCTLHIGSLPAKLAENQSSDSQMSIKTKFSDLKTSNRASNEIEMSKNQPNSESQKSSHQLSNFKKEESNFVSNFKPGVFENCQQVALENAGTPADAHSMPSEQQMAAESVEQNQNKSSISIQNQPVQNIPPQEMNQQIHPPIFQSPHHPHEMSHQGVPISSFAPGVPTSFASVMPVYSRAPPNNMLPGGQQVGIPPPSPFHPSFDFLKMLPPSVGGNSSSKGRPRKKKHIEDQLLAAYSAHGVLDADGGLAPSLYSLEANHRVHHHHMHSHLAPFGHITDNSHRSKRMRTSFKHHQLQAMKQYFNANHNPDAKDLKSLAQKTGLTKRVLQVWFQNARAKFRRNLMREQNQDMGSGMSEKSLGDDILDDDLNRRELCSMNGSEGGNDSTFGELDESFSDGVEFDDESMMSYSPDSSTESLGGTNSQETVCDDEDEISHD